MDDVGHIILELFLAYSGHGEAKTKSVQGKII